MPTQQYFNARDYVRSCAIRKARQERERRTFIGLTACFLALVLIIGVIWRVNVLTDRAADRKHHDSHPTLEIRP